MSVLQGFRLSLKLDFIRDRFLHSSCTPNKKTRTLTTNPLSFLFLPACGLSYSIVEEGAQTLGSCLQFFAFQP